MTAHVLPRAVAAAETATTVQPAAPAVKPNPSKLRLALLMLVAIYPLITVILTVLAPLTEGWANWERTLVIAPLMVFSIVFGIAPRIQKHFGWWIARMPRPVRR